MTHPAKTAAHTLRAHLAAHHLNPLGQQRALNVIAALHGTDWNTLSAHPHRPRLAARDAALALQRALAHYGNAVDLDWAQAAVALLSDTAHAGVPVPSLTRGAVVARPEGPADARPGAAESTLFAREDRYVPRFVNHPGVFVDRRVHLATPWPLLPLPDTISAALHRQLRQARTLTWARGTGLRIDGAAPAMPLPTLGPDARPDDIQAWWETLHHCAPRGTVTRNKYTPASQLDWVTFTRTLTVPECFTYKAQHAFPRLLMREARAALPWSIQGAEDTAVQAPRYDAFINASGVDGRCSAALSRRERDTLDRLEYAVLHAFPDRRPTIRDHVKHWRMVTTGQLLLTYEPYLVQADARIEQEAAVFRQSGWTVEVRRAAYAPGCATIVLGAPR
ncbi:hypothetical protein [Deinococcus radiotolerans]|nr:hypothetical protein [Deinococcus radiotolerans]